MFKVGDFVENTIYGKGVVTRVCTDSPIVWYPVEATFDKIGGSIKMRFNQEGKPARTTHIEKYTIHKLGEPMKKSCKFKVGDRVVSTLYGEGVVVQIGSTKELTYPVFVVFDKAKAKAPKSFTIEGKEYYSREETDIIEIITKFKVGDRVYSKARGDGTVVKINVIPDAYARDNIIQHPVEVHFDSGGSPETFAQSGEYILRSPNEAYDLHLKEEVQPVKKEEPKSNKLFQRGDKVKVTHKVLKEEGFDDVWTTPMDEVIGTICEVVYQDADGVRLKSHLSNMSFTYTPSCMIKVDEEVTKDKAKLTSKTIMEALLAGHTIVDTSVEGRTLKLDGEHLTGDMRKFPLDFRFLEVREKGILINGYTIPEPVREIALGTTYYAAIVSWNTTIYSTVWKCTDVEQTWLKNGLVHLTEDAAIEHIKALLSFTKV